MSKVKFIMLVTILSGKILFAQTNNFWSGITDFGGITRYESVAFSIGNKGYVGLGYHVINSFPYPHTYLTDFWEYDPANNTWTQKADFPAPGRRFPAYFVINSKGYIGMGYTEASSISERLDFWEYDPATDTWTQKADFAGAARQEITGFSVGNKGYAGLGNLDGAPSGGASDLWEYDPATDAWARKADCPNSYELFGLNIGDKGYVGFGTAPLTVTHIKDFWQYDPATDTWARKADYAGKASSGSFCFSIGQYGYLGTGYQDSAGRNTNDFWQYNPAIDSWTQKDSFGGGIRELAVAFSIGNYGYAGTGTNSTNIHTCTKDFWRYTPDSIETGIKKIKDEMHISFYPNPVEDMGILEINISLDTKASITLIYQQGRQLETIYKGQLNNGSNMFNINTKSLSTGLYMIGINSGEVIRTIKFIKYE